MPTSSRQVLPGGRRERWLGCTGLGLGASWAVVALGDGGRGRTLHVGSVLVWLTFGAVHLVLGRTVLTADGVRPMGRLRRVPWSRVTSVYVTSSPDRRGQVALVVDGDGRSPAWVHDPAHAVLVRWEAETGRQAASYGVGGPPRS